MRSRHELGDLHKRKGAVEVALFRAYSDGNPERVSMPSRALAPAASKARLRQREGVSLRAYLALLICSWGMRMP